MNTLSKDVSVQNSNLVGGIFKKSIHLFYLTYLHPKSLGDDFKRREFILNIILVASVFLLGILFLFSLYFYLTMKGNYQGVPIIPFSVVVLIFISLYLISRAGLFVLASYILVSIYFLSITYAAYHWGIDLPTALLGFAMLIVIANILITTQFGFVMTLLIAAFIVILGVLQSQGVIHASYTWRYAELHADDGIEYAVVLLVIMVVSWLSNREIARALTRARASEAELKEERDMLEIKVEQRTNELQKIQAEKISQLYRFAEFGRLSSGLFHDLMNPLTGMSLYLENLNKTNPEIFQQAQGYLQKAFEASKRIDLFTIAVRKQLQHREATELFSMNDGIEHGMKILAHKAWQNQVEIQFQADEQIVAYNNPLKFHQIVVNLVSNAIDAYDGMNETTQPRLVTIWLGRVAESVVITVADRGMGIPGDCLQKIFDPFFTTKTVDKGTGIGLASTRQIVEKDLRGTIKIDSQVGVGTTFRISIPFASITEPEQRKDELS